MGAQGHQPPIPAKQGKQYPKKANTLDGLQRSGNRIQKKCTGWDKSPMHGRKDRTAQPKTWSARNALSRDIMQAAICAAQRKPSEDWKRKRMSYRVSP